MSRNRPRSLPPWPVSLLLLITGAFFVSTPALAIDDHLLLCEAVLTPTANEFLEIVNPTGATIALDDHYLSDDESYALLPGASGSGPAPSIASSDFIVRFPGGASVAPAGVVVVAFDGAGFLAAFGFAADFEIHGTDAGTPDMIAIDVGATAGLTNSGENAVLFTWDGASDLVADIDMVNLGTPSSTNDIADKTGISVDGPDADTLASIYPTDAFTMPQQPADPGSGVSTKRLLLEAANEISGGSGATGDDETSEQITTTWDTSFTSANPGVCDALPLVPQLVINEIHADPDAAAGDANGDGSVSTTQDEFVEIVNTTGVPIDLSGWTLADGFGVRHTFPAGSVLADQCAVVVFSGGTPTGAFGDALVQTSSTGQLGLNNGGDSVILNDGVNDVALASYGSEGGDNQSLTLDPDVTGALPRVRHSLATGSASSLYSPGTQIDGSNFAGCTPPPSGWVINEIHADPDATAGDANNDGAVSTTEDEFVEIVNNTGSSVDISGWTLADGFGVRHAFPPGTVIADQCAVVIFAGGLPDGTFAGAVVQTSSTGQLGFNNSGDSLTLNDGASDQATASYGSEGGDNQSLTLDPDVSGALPRVRHSLATGSAGSLFSPGTQVDGSNFAGCSLPDPWVINEIHADPDASAGDANGDGSVSTSQDEFVEIVNNTGLSVDISGWTLADGFGVRHTFVAGTVVPDQCAVVVFAGGTPAGSFGNALVQTASSGQLGLNNSGDSLTLNDGASDQAMATYGSEGGDNQSLTLDPDIAGASYVKHSLATGSGSVLYSPGTRIDGSPFIGCPLPPLEIWQIQGSGSASPFVGQTATTLANVVTAVGVDGFFIQTPAARSDGDIDTSDGIFVFLGAVPTVAVGDLVDVTGPVEEFFDFTELGFGSLVTAVAPGAGTVPAAITFDATTPSPDPSAPSCSLEFECYESMLVQVIGGSVSGPNQRFNPDPIAEVHIVAAPARAFREPGIEFPGLAGLPVWDGNPEVFELDPDKLGLPNQILPAGSSFDAVGVIGFEFGGYELWPTQLTVMPATVPQAVRARQPGELTVGSLNLFRLFDDAADGSEQVVSTAEYLRRLGKLSRYIREVLDAPEILAVQEVEKLGVLDDLAAVIFGDDATIAYQAFLAEGNDVGGIDVGFLVRDSVQVDAVTQLGATEILTFDGSLLHDRPPLLLEGSYLGNGSAFPIAVMAVHNRSLGGIDDSADGPRVRQKRLEQAQSIAQKVQDLQTFDPNVRLVVTGDFNAFEFTDGYVDAVGQIMGDFVPADNLLSGSDLVDPDLTNQVLSLAASDRYSFIFRGSAQVLDHALTSTALGTFVRGFEYGRGNADAAVDLINDDTTALRSSDHDGLVLYIMSDADGDGIPDDEDCTQGVVFGVHDMGLTDSQFFSVDLDSGAVASLGPLYVTGDYESVARDPLSGTLYTIGSLAGDLNVFDPLTGALTFIGTVPTVRKHREIAAASFHPDGTLWVYHKNIGLETIDLATADSTRQWYHSPAGIPRKWDAIAWDPTGSVLYAAQRGDLYRWDAINNESLVCDDLLPDKTEGLDYDAAGNLVGSSGSSVFVIDLSTCATTEIFALPGFDDVESLAFVGCS